MESTAEAQLDFSPFLSADADPEAILFGPVCHAQEAPREDQLLVTTRLAWLVDTRLKVGPSLLCDGAEVEVDRAAVCSNLSRAFLSIGETLRLGSSFNSSPI